MNKKLTRSNITRTIQKTLADFINRGEVKCAYDVGSGACESFAEEVLVALDRHPKLDAIEYANLTGTIPGDEWQRCNEIFDEDTFREFQVKVPPGISVSDLNASGLGRIGTHVFVRWSAPDGHLYFDAETPQGVDSPFSLPFAQRYLSCH